MQTRAGSASEAGDSSVRHLPGERPLTLPARKVLSVAADLPAVEALIFFTGDLGYPDSEGFLYVLGREKSLLIGHDG